MGSGDWPEHWDGEFYPFVGYEIGKPHKAHQTTGLIDAGWRKSNTNPSDPTRDQSRTISSLFSSISLFQLQTEKDFRPMSVFETATRDQLWLRMALTGVAGSGKTKTALRIATGIGGRIALIDSEHKASKKYAAPSLKMRDPERHRIGDNRFEFAILPISNFDPRNYISGIMAAEAEGFNIIIVDSLTHAWNGKGGTLTIVDRAAQQKFGGNSYAGWKDGTPIQDSLIECLLSVQCHLIVTMRSKMVHILETNPNTGKQVPRKVGMAPVQRKDTEYEFDIIGKLDMDHNMLIEKSRFDELDRQFIEKPTMDLGKQLIVLLEDGESPASPSNTLNQDVANRLNAAIQNAFVSGDLSPETLRVSLSNKGVSRVEQLLEGEAIRMLQKLEAAIAVAPEPTETKPDKPAAPVYRLPQSMIDELEKLLAELEVAPEVLRKSLSNKGVSRIDQLLVDDAAIMIRKMEGMLVKFPFESDEPATQPAAASNGEPEVAHDTEVKEQEFEIPDASRRPVAAAN